MQKLRMSMIVEDEKVSVDGLYELVEKTINAGLSEDEERIQSIDTVSFSKL